MTDTDTASTAAPAVDDTDGDLQYDAPDGSAATVVTQGDPIRSFLDLPTAVVREAIWDFDSDGISVLSADLANVGMVDVTFPADGMTSYDVDGDIAVGMPMDLDSNADLKSALSFARRGRGNDNGDPVRIDIYRNDGGQANRVRVAVIRPDQRTKRVSWFFAIDPDSLRQRPDIPSLDLPYRADVDVDTWVDTVDALKRHDHAWVTADGRDLIVGTQATRNPHIADDASADGLGVDVVELPNRAWAVDDADGVVDDADGSLFSTDYLVDFSRGVKQSKADSVKLSFGDEWPMKLQFTNTDWGISGQYMVAPRIQSDGDD
jgi:hypothetical protein